MARRSSSSYKHYRFQTSPDGRKHETAGQARKDIIGALEQRKAWCRKFEQESLTKVETALGDARTAPIDGLKLGGSWGCSLAVGGSTFVYQVLRIG